LVPWSKPPCLSFSTPGPSTWTRLTFSIALDHVDTQHLHITRQQTYCAYSTQAMVSLNTLNQSSIISSQSLIIFTHGHISNMCSQMGRCGRQKEWPGRSFSAIAITRSKPRETTWSRSQALSGLKGWAPDRMVVTEGVPVNLILQLTRRESW
jgi:hypothetical protein